MDQVAQTRLKPLHLEMLELATGHFRAQAVCTAAALGIADLLKSGPKGVEELGRATGAHPQALRRLLRALASIGVFQQDDHGDFELTPLATTLLSDSPDSVLNAVLLAHAPFHWNSWSQLRHAVLTGASAFEYVHGSELFDYLRRDRAAAQVYEAWMTRLSEMQAPALVNSYDYVKFPTIVDVGGGHGALLVAILHANSSVRGVLFDLPEVLAGARLVREGGVESRCSVVAGDMFDHIPPGESLYILKTVIHDWDDDSAVRILRNCREAMSIDSRLLLIESIVPEGNEPHPSKFMDLNMLVLTHGGRERTAAEYRALLRASGFELSRIIATPSPMSLLEGIPQ
ncbi:MAG: methyltransferase [bacterium]|jgi:hypothetical protein